MLVNSNQRAACKFLAAMDEDGRIPSSSLCMRMLVGIRPRINANRTRNILSLTHSHSLDPRPSPCARLFSHLLLRPVTMLVTWTGAGYPAGRFHLDNAPFVVMKHGHPHPRFNIPGRSNSAAETSGRHLLSE
jgi:hypothetical protein